MGFFGGGASAGIGGSTGATDNAILRADGTGAATLQNSDLNIDDASTSTQNNVAITNQHSGQTDSALVLTPKGTGAIIIGAKPDGGISGGNARGLRAIDISLNRGSSTRVASGNDSVLIGNESTASGASSIAIGRTASASGGNSRAIGGGCSASNNDSISIGKGCTSSGEGSIAIGADTTATANDSLAVGRYASASAVLGAAFGMVTANLRGQFVSLPFRSLFWSGTTTNNTPTILNLDGTATNRFTIAANTAAMVDLNIIARRTDTVDKWFSSRRTVAIRRNNANGTAIIGSVQNVGTDQTEGSPTWSAAITADDTNEALQVEVTGAAGETVSWRVMAFYQVV